MTRHASVTRRRTRRTIARDASTASVYDAPVRSAAALLLLLLAAPASADDEVTLRTEKLIGPEQCLALAPADVATRCPGLGGRLLTVAGTRYAFIERYEPRRVTLFCDEPEPGARSWRCRRIVVIDHEPRGARRRNPQAFVTAAELLRLVTSAPSVKLGDELGALFAPSSLSDRPRTCLELRGRGCAVQAVRLKAPAKDGTAQIRRRLWLVEDADGPLAQCSDQALTRCDPLDAAAWLTLAFMLRPSSLAPPSPPPDLDVPEVRSDKRLANDTGPLTPVEAADTPAGALDPFVKQRAGASLPRNPSRADVAKVSRAMSDKGRTCLADAPQAKVDLVLTGDGNLLSLTVDGVDSGAPHDCLLGLAKKLPLPRFASATYRLSALVRRK
jgi:hypothetical protein